MGGGVFSVVSVVDDNATEEDDDDDMTSLDAIPPYTNKDTIDDATTALDVMMVENKLEDGSDKACPKYVVAATVQDNPIESKQ